MHCPTIQLGQGPHPSPIQGRGSRHFRISEAIHCTRFSRYSPALCFSSRSLSVPLGPILFVSSLISLQLTLVSILVLPSLVRPLFPRSESSRSEGIVCFEEHREGGSRDERKLAVDGVFRGGDMESGNSCLAW